MKGVLIVLLGATAVVLAVVAVVCFVKAWRAWRWLQALRTARWEPHTAIRPGGRAAVGVRKVARCGRRVEVLQAEDVTEVDTADPFSLELLDAENTARLKADAYNTLDRRSANA